VKIFFNIELSNLILNVLLIFILGILFLFAVTFYRENEKRASLVSVFLASILLLIISAINIFEVNNYVNFIIISFIIISILIFAIPLRNKYKIILGIVKKQYDERDIMFSRNELIAGTQEFDEYYKRNPEKKLLDDKFRIKSGILSENSTEFNKYKFASSDANFSIVQNFIQTIKEKKLVEKKEQDPIELTNYIKKWLKQIGAVDVGVTELKSHHLYSVKGRGERYGKSIENTHKYAIAFVVEMDKDMLDTAPKAEVIMESSQQYLESAKIASQLTNFIRNLGYSAKPHFDGNYDLICPVVAKDAGLGEFGRMGLLMTPSLGPRVRIAVVTTDIPLITNEYRYNPSIVDFCTICKKCANNCPSNAISFNPVKEEDGVLRWKINHEACFTYWNITGTDCGKCIQVCPFSHPNNLMHNIVRNGIKNSYLFGQIALQMDNLFYGKFPELKTNKFL
jgi:reductive dehalogenase